MLCAAGALAFALLPLRAGAQESRVLLDTISIQAEGRYEAPPDLATLNFHVRVQDKELRRTYEQATEALNRILALAERNGLGKDDVSTGALTVVPVYNWSDRRQRARAYRVEAGVQFRLRDFSKVGPIIDEAVEGGVAEFRSLSYSLADEETARRSAVAAAMRSAEARARAAIEQNGRKLGAARNVSVDIKQPMGIVYIEALSSTSENVVVGAGTLGSLGRGAATGPLPEARPEKITVIATVQCIFQIL